MSTTTNARKVTLDTYWFLMKTSLWFTFTVLLIYVALHIFLAHVDVLQQNFLSFAVEPAKIYMLVMGILSVFAFLTFFMRQGVTRKDYFTGTALSAFFVSITLMIVFSVLSFIHQLFAEVEPTSFIGDDASWFALATAFTLNVFLYYIVGWLIGAGFYRYGWIGGCLYILIALLLVITIDNLWEFELDGLLKTLTNVSMEEFPTYLSVIGSLLLCGISLWMIRASTKRIEIKVK
ncbi:hypothetical protein LF817_17245 [Halobacillus sp. A1]|uniref:hypothetical protein n=1 Tax=Halobacillus sp. A1 TaxID=2880262 RepID=UPI0020A66706|nr:hypothetical protein [Halobacillus sp. A1]MCP3033073.1 hypothetical protein [Halobacillus sp. A1]